MSNSQPQVSGPAATTRAKVISILLLIVTVLPSPWTIDSKENVHRLLTDPRFYDEFLPGVEWILKYESDSILCANSENSLDDWLQWDWTGAPRIGNNPSSGTGGLSLRRASAIKRILKFQMRYNDTSPEDEWFASRISVLPGARVAEDQLASEGVIPNALGYHIRDGGQGISDDVWKDPVQRRNILDYCPELSLIMDMKLERERCEGDNMNGTIGTQMPTDAVES
ncbi:hypothetical protein GGR57DRAFT_510033 [Xylariaceae sp. FL1272]|nr:hypothetical protein GGR57DRAFT_510033 [Xylariaceae sp. FL1272]